MRKISLCAAGVAVLILIGVGTWIGVGTGTTPAFAASTISPLEMMTTVKGLPTSHYIDYSVVFN
jgi:ribose 5-phosphate isomerase